MFYEFHITLPANTPEADPVALAAPLAHGIIVHVEVEFPPGCYGLAGVRVIEREHQIYPTNDDEWFISDAYVIHFTDVHYLYSPPFSLRLEGFNQDDTYQHRITLRFQLIHPEETLAKKISDIFFGLESNPAE